MSLAVVALEGSDALIVTMSEYIPTFQEVDKHFPRCYEVSSVFRSYSKSTCFSALSAFG